MPINKTFCPNRGYTTSDDEKFKPLEDVDRPRFAPVTNRPFTKSPYTDTIKLISEKYPRKPYQNLPKQLNERNYVSYGSAEEIRAKFKNVHYISVALDLDSEGEERASESGPIYYVMDFGNIFIGSKKGGK
jgi:hypothetical protein